MIYLASPYTGRDSYWPQSTEDIRFRQALHATAILTSRSRMVLSPIVLGHTIDQAMKCSGLPRPGYDWWMAWSRELLESCDSIYVLCIDGWEDSRGVQQEIALAQELELPIVYIDIEANHLERPEE